MQPTRPVLLWRQPSFAFSLPFLLPLAGHVSLSTKWERHFPFVNCWHILTSVRKRSELCDWLAVSVDGYVAFDVSDWLANALLRNLIRNQGSQSKIRDFCVFTTHPHWFFLFCFAPQYSNHVFPVLLGDLNFSLIKIWSNRNQLFFFILKSDLYLPCRI